MRGETRRAPVRHIGDFVRSSLRAIGPDRGLLLWLVALATLSGAVQTLLLFFLAMIGIALSSPEQVPTLIHGLDSVPWQASKAWLIPIAGILTALILVAAYPIARLQATINARTVLRTRTRLIAGYIGASHAYRLTHREGYLQQLVGEHTDYVSVSVQHFIGACVVGTTLCVLLLAPLLLNPKIGAAALVGVAVTFGLLGPVARRLRRDSTQRSAANRALAGDTAQMARLSDEIETYHVGAAVRRRLDARATAAADSLARLSFHDSLVPVIYQYGALAVLLAALGAVTVLYPGRHPGVAVMALLLVRILVYGRQLLALVQQGGGWAPSVELVENEIAALTRHGTERGTARPSGFAGLVLHDVRFGYVPGHDVLRGITLQVVPGEAIGIVGPSGGGKSSLCALLMGLRAPDSGSVTSGGIAVDRIDGAAWARTTAYVPQEPKLLTGTVADNIHFYRDGHDQAAVEAAARAAHLHDEIVALPQGYATMIGPGAQGLSGGQRQRLVIARALLGRPALMVLDEPSSALDRRSERLISETLAALKGHTTLVLIAHRPATLGICDRVFRLEQGQLLPVQPR